MGFTQFLKTEKADVLVLPLSLIPLIKVPHQCSPLNEGLATFLTITRYIFSKYQIIKSCHLPLSREEYLEGNCTPHGMLVGN